MGIRGFNKALKNYCAAAKKASAAAPSLDEVSKSYPQRQSPFFYANEVIHEGSILNVDALGFIFYILNKATGQAPDGVAASSHEETGVDILDMLNNDESGEEAEDLYEEEVEVEGKGGSLLFKNFFRCEFGGDYTLYDRVLREEVAQLQELKVFEKIAFYFDGSVFSGPSIAIALKDHTTKERITQREEGWIAIYNYAHGRRNNLPKQSTLPKPPLVYEQFLKTLEAIKREQLAEDTLYVRTSASRGRKRQRVSPLEIIHCEGEADQEIAKQCFEYNIKTTRDSTKRSSKAFCYALDTDFLFMKGCPVIFLGDLSESVLRTSKASGSRPTVCARVWRREMLAAALEMTERQFVEWAILIGNDYTSQFPRSQRKIVGHRASGVGKESASSEGEATENESLPEECHFKHIESLRQILVGYEEGAHVWSPVETQQLAIQYSRAFYELEDLNSFVDTEEKDKSTDEKVEDDSQSMMSLSRQERREMGKWKSDPMWILNLELKGLGLAIIDKLRTFLSSRGEVEEEHKAAHQQETKVDEVTQLFEAITPTHIIALEMMIDKLQGLTAFWDNGEKLKVEETGFGLLSDRIEVSGSSADPDAILFQNPTTPPRWSDVNASHVFQLIVRSFITGKTFYQQGGAACNGLLLGEPRHIFHGPLFHNLMARLHAQREEEVAVENQQLKQRARNTAGPGTVRPKPGRTRAKKMASRLMKSAPMPAGASQERLPIDAHREEILERIRSDRVTIIHGETGCGKSSRLPLMLLEDADTKGDSTCNIYISQPRRIAVTGLLQRLRPQLGKRVGMRMGHGIVDVSPETRLTFATTGYLVRLISHHPELFEKVSHLIIDEVHERSIDGDVICMLCRKLLKQIPDIKIILMSATIHTTLYRDYFLCTSGYRSDSESDDGWELEPSASKPAFDQHSLLEDYGSLECLSVGARRYPLTIKFAEHLANEFPHNPPIAKWARDLAKGTSKTAPEGSEISQTLIKMQYRVAEELIRSSVPSGAGVLVFLSGMTDIEELSRSLEGDGKYLICPIHSDIPLEEQLSIFSPTPADKVKVVLATNAAESSITVPDVDFVICLGTHKAMQYNARQHRSQLVNTWISKASATQRAGRTGRTKPGTVIRLYSERLYEKMREHELAEIHRTTLEEVILQLLAMLGDSASFEGVVPVVKQLIEPPDMENVQQSLLSLYKAKMITVPDGFMAGLTFCGQIASQLPVPLQLARLIIFGILLDVGPEAIVLAAAIAVGKTPFRMAVPVIHKDPAEYNQIVKQTMLAAEGIDQGCASEPIVWLKLAIQWMNISSSHKAQRWAHERGLVPQRLNQIVSLAKSLQGSLGKVLAVQSVARRRRRATGEASVLQDQDFLDLRTLSRLSEKDLAGERLNLVRLILTWTFKENIIRLKSASALEERECSRIVMESADISREDVAQLLPEGIEWEFRKTQRKIYTAAVAKMKSPEMVAADLIKVGRRLEPERLPLMWVISPCGQKASAAEGGKTKVKYDVLLILTDEMIDGLEEYFSQREEAKEGELDVEEENLTEPKKAVRLLAQVWKARDTFVPFASNEGDFEGLNSHGRGDYQVYKSVLRTTAVHKLGCLHEKLARSMFILIPSTVKATLRTCNISLSEDDQRRIFFGLPTSQRRKAEDDLPLAAVLGNTKISCQILNSKPVIQFPNPPTKVGSGAPRLGSLPLLRDAPLGFRLLSAYRVGHRDKKLKLPLKEGSSRQTHVQKGLTEQEDDAQGNIDAMAADDGPSTGVDGQSIGMTPSLPIWEHVADNDGMLKIGSKKGAQALMSRYSFQTVSTHQGRGDVFAVASSTMNLGFSGRLTSCEGVTILPPGSRWLMLALLCDYEEDINEMDYRLQLKFSSRREERETSKESTWSTLSESGSSAGAETRYDIRSHLDGIIDYPVEEDDIFACSDLQQNLLQALEGDEESTSQNQYLRKDEKIITKINEIFKPWIELWNDAEDFELVEDDNAVAEESREQFEGKFEAEEEPVATPVKTSKSPLVPRSTGSKQSLLIPSAVLMSVPKISTTQRQKGLTESDVERKPVGEGKASQTDVAARLKDEITTLLRAQVSCPFCTQKKKVYKLKACAEHLCSSVHEMTPTQALEYLIIAQLEGKRRRVLTTEENAAVREYAQRLGRAQEKVKREDKLKAADVQEGGKSRAAPIAVEGGSLTRSDLAEEKSLPASAGWVYDQCAKQWILLNSINTAANTKAEPKGANGAISNAKTTVRSSTRLEDEIPALLRRQGVCPLCKGKTKVYKAKACVDHLCSSLHGMSLAEAWEYVIIFRLEKKLGRLVTLEEREAARVYAKQVKAEDKGKGKLKAVDAYGAGTSLEAPLAVEGGTSAHILAKEKDSAVSAEWVYDQLSKQWILESGNTPTTGEAEIKEIESAKLTAKTNGKSKKGKKGLVRKEVWVKKGEPSNSVPEGGQEERKKLLKVAMAGLAYAQVPPLKPTMTSLNAKGTQAEVPAPPAAVKPTPRLPTGSVTSSSLHADPEVFQGGSASYTEIHKSNAFQPSPPSSPAAPSPTFNVPVIHTTGFAVLVPSSADDEDFAYQPPRAYKSRSRASLEQSGQTPPHMAYKSSPKFSHAAVQNENPHMAYKSGAKESSGAVINGPPQMAYKSGSKASQGAAKKGTPQMAYKSGSKVALHAASKTAPANPTRTYPQREPKPTAAFAPLVGLLPSTQQHFDTQEENTEFRTRCDICDAVCASEARLLRHKSRTHAKGPAIPKPSTKQNANGQVLDQGQFIRDELHDLLARLRLGEEAKQAGKPPTLFL